MIVGFTGRKYHGKDTAAKRLIQNQGTYGSPNPSLKV